MHVPKTAGNSWASSLVIPGELVQKELNCYSCVLRTEPRLLFTIIGHERRVPGYVTLEQHLKRTPHRSFVVAFVRNPFDRLVSAFFHLQRGGLNELDRVDADNYTRIYGDNFASFVRNELVSEAPSALSQIHFRPQRDWLIDQKGQLLVDFLGRFETIEADADRLAEMLGFRANQMPRLNLGRHAPYYDLYDADTQAIVARAYRKDFEIFGYSTTLARFREL